MASSTPDAHISRSAFEEKLPNLIEGRYLLPKKRQELRMLLLSTVCGLDAARNYSEAEVNECLQAWVERYGTDLRVDRVTLRRYLVDEGILDRDRSGSLYRLAAAQRYFSYDAAIRSVDLDNLLHRARCEREARKQAFLEQQPNDPEATKRMSRVQIEHVWPRRRLASTTTFNNADTFTWTNKTTKTPN